MAGTYAINHDRASWVIPTLIRAWRERLPPFDHAEPVPSRLPSNLQAGTVEHAVWLMCGLLYMRGRIDSAQAFLRLARVYEDHPWMFIPDNFRISKKGSSILHSKMYEILRENGLGFNVKETVRFWDFNLRKLVRFWKGNPIRIFDQAQNYEELCELFMKGKRDLRSRTGFMGFRHKMVSMYVYFLINGKLIKPFMHPGPVDTHNIRVMASTEMIVTEEMVCGARYDFYAVSPVARELYEIYCKNVDDVLDLANALWYLSRDFCSASQGNSTSTGGYRARATELRPKKIVWTRERIQRYESTCGLCPVEDKCRWSLPTARQYNHGFLEIRNERPRPHVHQESLVQIERTLRSRGQKPQAMKWMGENEFTHMDQRDLFD